MKKKEQKIPTALNLSSDTITKVTKNKIKKLVKKLEKIERAVDIDRSVPALKVEGVGWKGLGLSSKIKDALSRPVNGVIGDDYRVVFISYIVHSDDSNELKVGRKARDKFLLPQLKKLIKNFDVVGSLSPPSIIKLTSPRVTDALASGKIDFFKCEYEKLVEESKNKPPYAYGIFVFPAVRINHSNYATDRDFFDEVRKLGIDVQEEGAIGPIVRV